MKISYAITVCDELSEFERLITALRPHLKAEDEIVVLVDTSKGCGEVFLEYSDVARIKYDKFEGNFSVWKNKLNSYCTGDWIFQIDADEVPSWDLLADLHTILKTSELTECIAVPRTNTVKDITLEDMQRWHWADTQFGINWPDYQYRIYKNTPKIRWEGKVHERPVGFKYYSKFPENRDKYKLIHDKTIEKQRKQNAYYSTIQR